MTNLLRDDPPRSLRSPRLPAGGAFRCSSLLFQIAALIAALGLLVQIARADDAWGMPPRPPVPAFSTYFAAGAGVKLAIAVPASYTAIDEPRGAVLLVSVTASATSLDEGAALTLFASPVKDETPFDSKTVVDALAQIARRLGFEPIVDAARALRTSDDGIAGFPARTMFASGKDERGRAAGMSLSAIEAPRCKVIVVITVRADRFVAAATLLRLSAQSLVIDGADPKTPCRPVVLDPVPPPAAPLEGCFWRRETTPRYDVARDAWTEAVSETDYAFTRDGLVIDDLPDPGSAPDPVRVASVRPGHVGTYEASAGGPLVLRFPGRKPVTFERWRRDEYSLTLGEKRFARLDRDLSALALIGRYASESATRAKTATGTAAPASGTAPSIEFTADGHFQRSGGEPARATGAAAEELARLARRGTFHLGRGTITLRSDDGREVTEWLRIERDPGEKGWLDPIVLEGRTYTVQR